MYFGIDQQVLTPELLVTSLTSWVPENTLAIPIVVVALCLSFQLLHGCAFYQHASNYERIAWRAHMEMQGGLLSLVRLFGAAALASISLVGALEKKSDPEAWMTLTYLYSTALACMSLMSQRWGETAKRCNVFLLLVTLGVFVHRDIWPLATYDKAPKDMSDRPLFWVKFAILVVIGLFVPLCTPRRYVPVDPLNPMPEPNPEQTTSWWGFLFYGYLSPVIYSTSRMEHLDVDNMPPLMDSDASKHLIEYAFPYLDPYRGAKNRHIFFGLMHIFWLEIVTMVVDIVGYSLAGFLAPIAIYQLLNYMQQGPGHDIIRPWFWLFTLFIGAVTRTMFFQNFMFYATRMLTHTESLLTQLIFEHSLRVRLATHRAEDDKVPSSLRTTSAESPRSPRTGTNAADYTISSASIDGAELSSSVNRENLNNASSASSTVNSIGPEKYKVQTDKKDNLVGRINNLITTGLGNITDSRDFLFVGLAIPLQVVLSVVFLYKLLGWSALVGLASMIILLPLPGYATTLLQNVQKTRMRKTEARIQKTTEVVNVLKMIKLFGWENKMRKRIQYMRDDELSYIFKLKVLESLTGILNTVLPTITMIITYAIYTGIMKQRLSPSVMFSTLNIFGKLRGLLYNVSSQITQISQGKVSLDRINTFLKETELLDAYSDLPPAVSQCPDADEIIGFRNASFSWSIGAADGSSTPPRRAFHLRVDGDVIFKPNCINLIIGPTGSGKTSILMALLGEMHFNAWKTDSWFNLPRKEGVAYAPQESWVQNETIRDNILFGQPYDAVRYKKVIKQTCLDKDLEYFAAGDKTEVGEMGITLSGGQKARVTLARAIYSPARIILLDDVLAALDVHTSTWIVDKCLKGDLVQGRTVILVTHNVALVSPIARYVVSVGSDGTIKTQGTDISVPIMSDHTLAAEVEIDREILDHAREEIPDTQKDTDAPPGAGKLILAEEIPQGHVTWHSVQLFLKSLGGDYPLLFFSLWICGFLFAEWILAFNRWFLGQWGAQYETHEPSEVKASYYLGVYSVIVLLTILLSNISYFIYLNGALRASRKINSMLINSVLTSTLRWLNETPAARIISRCAQDIRMVDGPLPQGLLAMTSLAISMLTNIGVVIIFAPVFFFPGIAVASLGAILGNTYLKAQLSTKRELSNAKSPVIAHFNSSVAGIVSIRAYGAQAFFKSEASKRIDKYTRISRLTHNLKRWIGSRIDNIGNVYYVALACYLVYGRSIGSSNTGFTLNMASEFCMMILWWIRIFNDFEVQSNSLERIQGYIEIDHEPQATESGKPPAAWPTSGDLVVENLTARYSQDGPAVLHNISFHIKTGERVGIVGRTGSGKSSLTLSILRCILTEGTIYLDGIATDKVNLDALRSSITIIPQMPEMMSGTLRKNLDPFEQYDDSVLNDVLRSAGLFLLHEKLGHGDAHLILDSNITFGGGNLCVGEKQILALARAMLRRSKLLILDEATSAIDYKTDNIIQDTLRHQLDPDVTVITVAHRLQTIMDADKIILLDSGRIVEIDSPAALLAKEDGLFKALVDASRDKEALYKMAEKRISAPHNLLTS